MRSHIDLTDVVERLHKDKQELIAALEKIEKSYPIFNRSRKLAKEVLRKIKAN